MSSNPLVTVAAPGWDARTAPDWALVYSNQWPSLTILFEKTIAVPPGNFLFSIPINLNITCLAMAWITVNGVNYGRIPDLEVSPTFVFGSIPNSIPNSSYPSIITICCYDLDVTKEASYPLPQSASTKFAPHLTTSIKVAKTNRNIGSKNLNDFILNSQAQSPAILQVATQSGQYFKKTDYASGFAIVYPLKTPYIPWIIGMVSIESGPVYTYYDATALDYDAASNSLILNFGEIGDHASLIVLRDPLFYPNTVRAIY